MYSFASFLPLLIKFKYFILFPACAIEGPIVTIMAAFLASSAGGFVMNLTIVFIVVVIADITGDTFYYLVGRWGQHHVDRWGPKVGLTPKRFASVEEYFRKYGVWTIIIGKIGHGLGWPAMVVAGSARMPYSLFITVNVITSIVKSGILVALGYYYGENYVALSHHVSRAGLLISTAVIAGIVIYFLFFRKKKKAI